MTLAKKEAILKTERISDFVETANADKLIEVIRHGGSTTRIRIKKNKTALLDSLGASREYSRLVDFERSQDRILFTERL